MKKLLSILSSLIITGSVAAPVVSCSYDMEASVNDEAAFYSLVSAQALKEAILNDQNLKIGKTNESINYKFTSNYYGRQKIGSVFGNMFSDGQGASFDPEDSVFSLYDTVFGRQSAGWNITNGYDSLKSHNGVKAGTNLGKMVYDNANDIGSNPDSDTADKISAASGVAQMVLGTDFSTGLASTVIGLLSSTTIANALNSNDILGIINNIETILEQNQKSLSSIIAGLTQNNVDKDITVEKQLENTSDQLMQGLIYLISIDKEKNTSVQYTKPDKDSEKYPSAPTVFWHILLGQLTDDDKKTLKTVPSNTDNMLVSVSQIVPFVISLIHYFKEFDAGKLPGYQTRIVTDDQGKSQELRLFDREVSNPDYKKKILEEKYVNDSDDFWYVDNNEHYAKLNLQNLFSDLNYYFSPTPLDSNGYQTIRAINILFGGYSKGPDNKLALNPFIDTMLSPLLVYLQQQVDGVLSKITSIPLIGSKLAGIKTSIDNLLSGNGFAQVLEWISTDGYYGEVSSTIQGILNAIKGILSLASSINSKDIPAEYKQYFEIIVSVSEYLNSTNGQTFIKHPWQALYKEVFSAISQTRIFTNPGHDKVAEIGYGLNQLNGLRNILAMPLNMLVEAIGHIINSKIVLPDWVYGIKNYSIGTLFTTLATQYNTNAYKKLSDNKEYAISSEAIEDVVRSLIPNGSSDASNIKVTVDLNGKTKIVSPILAIYYSIVYSNPLNKSTTDLGTFKITVPGSAKEETIITSKADNSDNKSFTITINSKALNYLFGVKEDDNGVSFSKGSVFYAISRLYGHNYEGHADYAEMSNGVLSLVNLFSTFGTFAETSIDELVKDNYYKYLDPKNWQVSDVQKIHWENTNNEADTVFTQTLRYNMVFINPIDNKRHLYKVEMTRKPYTGAGAWEVDKLWNEY